MSANDTCGTDEKTQVSPPRGDLCEARAPGGNAGFLRPRFPPAPFKQTRLLHPCATPLNQDDQHDNKEHTGYDPDNRGSVHIDFLPSWKWLKTIDQKTV
jgi:hypothetical protein